jgi:hypothetical protein
MGTPYIGFGNDSLKNAPPLTHGDVITCPRCGEVHTVEGGKNEKGEITDTVLAYKCGDKLYLAGVAGKCVIKKKPDVSGKI